MIAPLLRPGDHAVQLRRAGGRQGLVQRGIIEDEHGGIDADPQRQRDDRGQGECPGLPQHPDGMTKILNTHAPSSAPTLIKVCTGAGSP